MSEGIIIALISGGLSVIGYVIGAYMSQSKTLYRLEQLEKKQDKHNSLIERMYIAEDKINLIEQRIDSHEHKSD